ncbi:MAG: type VI secretion system baseplate subunit TssF, partial [Pseudomonadota bacterium]
LLGILYPHYLAPIPSLSIVEFQLPEDSQLTGRHVIPRHAELLTRPVNGMPCRFRTAYPVELWPITVSAAVMEPVERSPFALGGDDVVALVRIRLRCLTDQMTFTKLGIDRLRFFLDGEPALIHALHELLLNNTRQVSLVDVATPARRMNLRHTRPQAVGFSSDEGVLDYGPRSFIGYRLLQEYFAFPDKFLFFDLTGLEVAMRAGFGREVEVVIALGEFERRERLSRLMKTVEARTFRLGCTPIVNLFRQAVEPVRLTHQKTEYLVMPDARRPWGMEVYSVDRVTNVVQTKRQEDLIQYQPFYSYRHALQPEGQSTFWYANRRTSPRQDDPGTDVYLSLVDLNFDPSLPATETLSISATCTNRDLPALLPFGNPQGDFDLPGGASGVVARIRALRKPTPTVRLRLRRGLQWRLISHLSLNHLSLVQEGREALLEILNLYNFADAAVTRRQIGGIVQLTSRPGITRVGVGAHAAFMRGTEVELELDEDQFVGGGVYLLASVLEQFLGLYCALNSYTRLTVRSRQREKVLAQWPPRLGDAHLV